MNSVSKIDRRFKLLEKSFEGLKTYFENEVPYLINFEFHYSNMTSNYSSFLNNIMAILDFTDSTHPNKTKPQRTGFNVNDLKKSVLPLSKYNPKQISFLEGVKQLFVTRCSFNKKDIENWIDSDTNNSKKVDLIYSELKSLKHFNEKNQSLVGQRKMDEQFKIKFKNSSLSIYKENIENEIGKLLKSGEETTLEIFRKIRNEEEHFLLTEKNIINRHCYKIGTAKSSLITVNKNASAFFEKCTFILEFNGQIKFIDVETVDLGSNSLIINGKLTLNKCVLQNKKNDWKTNLITINKTLTSNNSYYISQPSFDSFLIDKEVENVELINCSFVLGTEVYNNISLVYENNEFTKVSDSHFFEKFVTENLITNHTITLNDNNIEIDAKELTEQLYNYSYQLYDLYLEIENNKT